MSLWLEEAERRERKRVFKEMPFNEEEGTGDTSQSSSLYPFRKLQCAKVNHDLDSWPHQPSTSYSPPATLPLDQDQTQELWKQQPLLQHPHHRPLHSKSPCTLRGYQRWKEELKQLIRDKTWQPGP